MQGLNICVFYTRLPMKKTDSKQSHLQAVATIQERLVCRYAVSKVQLLPVFENGFYQRAALIQDFAVLRRCYSDSHDKQSQGNYNKAKLQLFVYLFK